MRRIEISDRARTDIDTLYHRILWQDAMTAVLVLDRIEETFENLCVFPQMGKPTNRKGVWAFGGSAKSPFRVTYRFDENLVSVVRVFRSSRDRRAFEG